MQQVTSLFCTFGFLLSLAFVGYLEMPTWIFLAVTPMVIYWAHLLEPTSNFLAAILAYAWHPRLPRCPWLAPFTIPIQSFILSLVVLNALTVVLHHLNVWAKLFPHRVVFPKDPSAVRFQLHSEFPFPSVSLITNKIRNVRSSTGSSSTSSGESTNSTNTASSTSSTTYRPPCNVCNRWHKKGQILCDVPPPRMTVENALHGDITLKKWLAVMVQRYVTERRHTVVLSFVQSAKVQVYLARKVRDFEKERNIPIAASTHTRSSYVEELIQVDSSFRSSFFALCEEELKLYAGLSALDIHCPLKTFINPRFQDFKWESFT